jgi:hypothetical protein
MNRQAIVSWIGLFVLVFALLIRDCKANTTSNLQPERQINISSGEAFCFRGFENQEFTVSKTGDSIGLETKNHQDITLEPDPMFLGADITHFVVKQKTSVFAPKTTLFWIEAVDGGNTFSITDSKSTLTKGRCP